jgi:hypothetical protein
MQSTGTDPSYTSMQSTDTDPSYTSMQSTDTDPPSPYTVCNRLTQTPLPLTQYAIRLRVFRSENVDPEYGPYERREMLYTTTQGRRGSTTTGTAAAFLYTHLPSIFHGPPVRSLLLVAEDASAAASPARRNSLINMMTKERCAPCNHTGVFRFSMHMYSRAPCSQSGGSGSGQQRRGWN